MYIFVYDIHINEHYIYIYIYIYYKYTIIECNINSVFNIIVNL